MRSQVTRSAGTSSASACSARPRSSVSVRAPTIDRANPYAAPTSVSASQGMTAPVTIHPQRRSGFTHRRPSPAPPPRFAVIGRVEPSARITRGEGLQDALDGLPGRRATDQALLAHTLLELEDRAVLAAVD